MWKIIYSGKKNVPDKDKVRALYLHINAVGQQTAFEIFSSKYGRFIGGLPKIGKMRFYPTWFQVHSESSREKLRNAIIHQKSFLDVVKEDRCSDITTLDTSTQGLPSLRELLGDLMSHSCPKLPLFISADQYVYENQGIVFQFMPHLAEEVSMMMHNLIPYLKHMHGDAVEPYFLLEAVEAAKKYTWDEENHQVVCPTDVNMAAEEDQDPFGLSDATTYMAEQATTNTKNNTTNPPQLIHGHRLRLYKTQPSFLTKKLWNIIDMMIAFQLWVIALFIKAQPSLAQVLLGKIILVWLPLPRIQSPVNSLLPSLTPSQSRVESP